MSRAESISVPSKIKDYDHDPFDHSCMTTFVLFSGGLDSAVLAAHEAQTARVLPVYVSVGLAWEDAEVAMVERLLRDAGVTRAASSR